jgi:hypothetical protein
MRKEYDFSKSVRNPYLNRLAKQVSLNSEGEKIAMKPHQLILRCYGERIRRPGTSFTVK